LISTGINIELKHHIIDSLTDILIAHGQYAYRYSGDILDKCLTIGCLIPPNDCDIDMVLTFNQIRCSIIDTIRTCLAELAQANKINNFNNYIEKINTFFKALSDDIRRVDVNVLTACIKLLSEAADYCPNSNAKQKLRTQWIQKILEKAGSIRNNPQLAQEAKNAFQQISKD